MRALLAALAFLAPVQALAAEVCVAVRPSADGESLYDFEIWLEKGPATDLTYAWACATKTDAGSSSAANSSYAMLKPDQEEKLGACSVSVGAESRVEISVDLSVDSLSDGSAATKKLQPMKFVFASIAGAKAQRACRDL